MRSLTELANNNPHPKEIKRALAIKMVHQGYKHQEIPKIFGVSSGFISKWTKIFKEKGFHSLKLAYKGSKGYLTKQEKEEILNWLKEKATWNLTELEYHIAKNYDVVFKSKQSYYDLFKAAGISWKKSQKKNPKSEGNLVAKKKIELSKLLENRRKEIESSDLIVYLIDECHLLWGDINGYIWGDNLSGAIWAAFPQSIDFEYWL